MFREDETSGYKVWKANRVALLQTSRSFQIGENQTRHKFNVKFLKDRHSSGEQGEENVGILTNHAYPKLTETSGISEINT